MAAVQKFYFPCKHCCVITADKSNTPLSLFLELFKEMKKDFPSLSEDSVVIVWSRRNRRIRGLRYDLVLGQMVPEHYKLDHDWRFDQ